MKKAFKWFYSRYLYTFCKRFERLFRSALFAVLSCFYPSFHPLRMFGVAHGVSSTKGKEVISPVDEKWILPKSVDHQLPSRFTEQSTHTPGGDLALILGGFSVTGGANLTAKGELLSEFTEQFTARSIKDHKLFTFKLNRFFNPVPHFDTSVVSLVADCQNNYFHWLFDILPKLCLLEKENIQVEKYHVEVTQQFQQDALDLLGIDKNKIISSVDHPIISASSLYVTSFPCDTPYPHPRWISDYIRDRFLPLIPPSPAKRVYISRSDASIRHVVNEKDLVDILEKEGFVTVQLTKLSFLEQIALFKGAEIIVAPHGAGLSNLAFCSPATKVIELACPRDPCVCFWLLGHHRKLDYHFLSGEKDRAFYSPVDTGHDNIFVDLEKFRKTLDLACGKAHSMNSCPLGN